jgi:hypothetical protein
MYKAYHSPCDKMKNEWSFTPTPAYAFMAWYILKHRDFNTTSIFRPDLLPELHSSTAPCNPTTQKF